MIQGKCCQCELTVKSLVSPVKRPSPLHLPRRWACSNVPSVQGLTLSPDAGGGLEGGSKRPTDMRLKVGSFLERKGHSSQGNLISFVKTTGKCPSQAGLWHAVWLCDRGRCKDKIQHLPRRVHSPHPWVLLLEVMPPSNSLDQVLKETWDSTQAGSLTLNTLYGVLLTHFPENTHETHSSTDTDLACWVKW